MQHFKAHRLHFVTQVQTTVELNEHQGSALRGAFYHALRRKFCHFSHDREIHCERCSLVTTCPVATLVSTLDPGHQRGRNRPRPYTIQPPLSGSGHPWEWNDGRVTFRYEPRETLSFGLTLYGEALALLPYVVLSTTEFEKGGLGRRLEQPDGRWRRGTVQVREVWTDNPLSGQRQPVIRKDSRQVEVPDIPVTHGQIIANAECRMRNAECGMQNEKSAIPPSAFNHSSFSIHFLTPTRLIEHGHLLKPETFRFRPFFQRLLERLEALSEQFSDTPLDVDFPALLQEAEAVRVIDHLLTWQEVRSYSTRRHRASQRGGLVGRVTLHAEDWSPLLPWIIWGQFTHVGKSTVKGNGMYRMMNREWRMMNRE
jgi:hypothetical protein